MIPLLLCCAILSLSQYKLSLWFSVSLPPFYWVIYRNGALINCLPNCCALAEGGEEQTVLHIQLEPFDFTSKMHKCAAFTLFQSDAMEEPFSEQLLKDIFIL